MIVRVWFTLFVLLTAGAAYSQDRGLMAREQRVALVVGNSNYQVGPLRNPGNDADDMASALQNLGFRVTKLKDASNRQMVEAINRFGQELRKGGVGLFFYAGHGVQSKGRNFLIPVGANIGGEDELEFESVDANRVLAAMDAAGNRVNIIILDACRDNPYARSFRSASRGLAQMEAAKGSLIAFATGPGSVAADGAGRNGLYTQHLLQSLNHPDSDIDKVFRRVTADVTRATSNRQVPWKADSLTGEFYFKLDGSGATSVALAPPTVPAPQTDARADDRALWETVKDSNNAAELQAYLEQFPNGIFAGVARARLKTLASGKPPVQVATAAPTMLAAKPPSVAATDFTPGTSFRDCDVCPEMVVIPPGSFTMGSLPSETGRFDTEGPQRSVSIPRALAVGKFEITRGEYAQFVQETGYATGACFVFRDGKWQEDATKNWRDPGYAQNDSHPVACVNWDDAKAYVAWISRKSGGSYRLLTEAEWEYAARAGTGTAYYWGDNASNNCQYANGSDQTFKTAFASLDASRLAVCTDKHAYTAPVGSFQANAFGLHDMSGNVWEWVEDCWNANYNGAPTDGGARTLGDCGLRLLRGGSWDNSPRNLRSALRYRNFSGSRGGNVGFRVARTP